MNVMKSTRWSDEALESIFWDTGDWVVKGRQGQVLCGAASLQRAVDRAHEFAQSGATVIAICRLPRDNIIVFPEQSDRLRRVLESDYFREQQRLAAIAESSDDAIIAKDLDGIITNWNRGAERLFGYSAAEAIGKPVSILIPADRQEEEPEILGRIRRGERIDHYETVRCRKNGTTVEISLTVSPIRDLDGTIVGASKVAFRDITERRRAHEQQQLLLREMNHLVEYLFTLAGSIVTLSARSATTPSELARSVGDRLPALARVLAHC
jgi:PAS domain S-box-containing protein